MDDFIEEEFTNKANLRMKKIMNSYTLNTLENVAHFMTKELYEKLQRQLENNNKRGVAERFDELNVNAKIASTKEDQDYYYVLVKCFCKYIHYEESLESGKVISGDKERRREMIKEVLFQKRKDATSYGEVARCLGCGTSINVNENGKCPNCGRIFDLEKYDYIIKEMDL